MLIATWNLNNRVGKKKFHPEAADAAIALGADIVVFTEFFPGSHLVSFKTTLEDAGWPYQLLSEDTKEISNRILIVSKVPLEPLSLDLPTFDKQFPANLLCAFIPSLGISLIGVRVPAYYGTKTASMLLPSWNWMEEAAQALNDRPSIILGDFNVSLKSPKSKGGDHFRRILENGWHRALPTGSASYFGHGDIRTEIDHIIGTKHCSFVDSQYVEVAGEFILAGSPNSISDHAALISRVILPESSLATPGNRTDCQESCRTESLEFQNWMWSQDPEGLPLICESSSERTPIATVHRASNAKMLVRASLIAAAPGMYSTLQAVLQLLEVMADKEAGNPAGLAAEDMIPYVESALEGADFMGQVTPNKLVGN